MADVVTCDMASSDFYNWRPFVCFACKVYLAMHILQNHTFLLSTVGDVGSQQGISHCACRVSIHKNYYTELLVCF